MSGVRIYLEGGGDTAGQRKTLRQGMDVFLTSLKNKVREKRWGWKLIPSGGRQRTYEAFRNARDHATDGEIIVLLVDAEAPVIATTRVEHLLLRPGDEWDLTDVCEEYIHLMVQTMETWIVADPHALERYYGQDFNRNVLPRADDLESVGKGEIAQALRRATRRTTKGDYHKISHASDLLKRINPATVRQRCQHCEQLFDVLGCLVEEA